MALRAYTDGIGESAGDSLAVNPSLATSGYVWYVHSGTGVDAASPAGRERKRPLATLAQAQTNATDYDIICLMDGHTETLTAALALTKKLTIVGGGLLDGKPTVKLQLNASNQSLFTVGAAVWFRNIWFQAALQSTTAATIQCLAARMRLTGCYMELGANNLGGGIDLAGGWDGVNIDDTTFISTATSTAAVPGAAIRASGGADFLRMHGVTFDGGSTGFSSGFAVDIQLQAVSHLHAEEVRLLNGADVELGQNVGGWMQVSERTGGARIRWLASGGGG